MFMTALTLLFLVKLSQAQFLCIHDHFYYFWIIIKNLTKCNILNSINTLAFKKYGKFANHNL